jgi:hypothetical protein
MLCSDRSSDIGEGATFPEHLARAPALIGMHSPFPPPDQAETEKCRTEKE